mmetsp:Transcript_25511/g.79885  ORF Transcript_25511/g.79885 Transcript_25511/m.79885 type:complete len:204 (-) Transcript_25511:519-1130(-)
MYFSIYKLRTFGCEHQVHAPLGDARAWLGLPLEHRCAPVTVRNLAQGEQVLAAPALLHALERRAPWRRAVVVPRGCVKLVRVPGVPELLGIGQREAILHLHRPALIEGLLHIVQVRHGLEEVDVPRKGLDVLLDALALVLVAVEVDVFRVAVEELFREDALAHLALVRIQHAVAVEVEALRQEQVLLRHEPVAVDVVGCVRDV